MAQTPTSLRQQGGLTLLHEFLYGLLRILRQWRIILGKMIFVETHLFTQRVVQAMSDDDYRGLQSHLVDHPDAGVVIPGSGGIRKIRWRGSGRGKRGGSRTLYFWNATERIYMLYLYLKNERENVTPKQLAVLRATLEEEGLK